MVDENGNRHEIIAEGKKIIIKYSKVDLNSLLKEVRWTCIEMDKEEFKRKLENATKFLEGKKYHLAWRNCYKLLKYVTGYNMREVRMRLKK